MSRRDALLRLHKSLVARRDELRKRIGGGLKDLRRFQQADASGDSADQALSSGSDEVAFQLAELESRELVQIERALTRLKQGTYGVCEGCHKKIPVTRLNALPFSTTCIECQREMELYGTWKGAGDQGDWDKVADADAPLEEQRDVDISEIEMDLSSNR
jgi:DnaK suppressor protein